MATGGSPRSETRAEADWRKFTAQVQDWCTAPLVRLFCGIRFVKFVRSGRGLRRFSLSYMPNRVRPIASTASAGPTSLTCAAP